MIKTIITFIFVFGVIVIIHEFGHYYFAKRSGILVREFAIGMGPKIFSHRKNGTTYTIRILPIGGYVRMAGAGEEEVELTPGMPISIETNEKGQIIKINTSKKVQLPNSIPLEVLSADLENELFITGYVSGDESQEKRFEVHHDATIIEENGIEVQIAPKDVQFQSAKLSHRIMTNFAGPLNNFILAAILFILVAFLQGGQPIATSTVALIEDDSPAQISGLKTGDEIIGINGSKTNDPKEITEIIQQNPDNTLDLLVNREGSEQTIEITPASVENEDNSAIIGRIGVGYASRIESLSFLGKIKYGFQNTIDSSIMIFAALKNLITGFSLDKLGGPVMIFEMSSEVASQGLITVLTFMAVLSVNLGIMNLLPIPALDGGKLVLNGIEGVRGKPLSQEKEGMITLVGFGFLMLLMILVTWNDIQRFFFR